MFMLNDKLFRGIINTLFPINKIEVFYDSADHSNYLGFTWERVGAGRVPVGLDTSDTDFNTIGKTGGEKKHTLTKDEIPSHNHSTRVYYGATGGSNQFRVNADGVTNDSGQRTVGTTANTGGGQSHNNLQPYIVMAFWKRVA